MYQKQLMLSCTWREPAIHQHVEIVSIDWQQLQTPGLVADRMKRAGGCGSLAGKVPDRAWLGGWLGNQAGEYLNELKLVLLYCSRSLSLTVGNSSCAAPTAGRSWSLASGGCSSPQKDSSPASILRSKSLATSWSRLSPCKDCAFAHFDNFVRS